MREEYIRILSENRMEGRFSVLKAGDRILLKLDFQVLGGGENCIYVAVITVQRQNS
jgi:hypothetical protein